MTRLQTQYQRLYQLPATESTNGASGLIGHGGAVRALVLALGKPADWAALAPVWRGVQADLALPAPAIAVNGVDAFELWFSLAQPVPVGEAVAFLVGLHQRYLAGLKPGRVKLWPTADATPWPAPPIPALHAPDRWSAFVAPDLAAVFGGDDPSLDFQPGEDAQAELLSRLHGIQADDWQASLRQLQPLVSVTDLAASTRGAPAAPVAAIESTPLPVALAGIYQDPREFLRAVMNDPGVALALRIEAAKALLP
ncbi:MAG: hypothetical protein KGZ70_01395 [Hydrogenophaga sp.]|uniref:hypothetical protein n=1 Tax=Hydrogenophaga sp. TaxID=1904254 RepID=UPI001BC3E544|nr:hypothetical protein [Hydrogenophaga sp.]MBS3910489.1 hypothetical protein [Hydrogenophaga sp.]MDP2164767.1 hypothetical protein [Hydrogenophaga sp.]MDP3477692.1 hypothetical protein [Hydrogenophaga sp.]